MPIIILFRGDQWKKLKIMCVTACHLQTLLQTAYLVSVLSGGEKDLICNLPHIAPCSLNTLPGLGAQRQTVLGCAVGLSLAVPFRTDGEM